MNKNKLIISLTTIPSRINLLEPVLDSILNQTVKPDLIYINIPVKYNRFENCSEIPKFIKNKEKVKIHYLDKDYGPATKFIGSLLNSEISKDDVIIVTDDDVIKRPHWISKLLLCHKPNKICCFEERNLGKNIIWGYLGYIFRKDIFDVNNLLKFYEDIKDNCILVDDHWLTGYCHHRKIPIYNIPISSSKEINKTLIEGNDSLVRIKGANNRWHVSEKCRYDIKKKFNTEFPFWCCMGCCRRGKRKVIEKFDNSNNSLYLRVFIFLIITYYVYSQFKKVDFLIYLLISFSLIIFYLTRHNIFEKFSSTDSDKSDKNDSKIPKIIIQTYYKKEKIPNKVYKNIKKYAPDYEHLIYDDEECEEFLKKYFNPNILTTFKKLKGAHKADLFRYCYLYKHGGVYLDIKTELIRPIDEVFNKNYTYSVLSIIKNTVYQGIIATPPKNPIFLKLIYFMVKLVERKVKFPYIIFTFDFFQKIKNYCGVLPTAGLNDTNDTYPYYLFTEKCSKDKNKCKDGLDRYGLCCYVYDGNERMIKSRYSDFPW
jgi:hypothetical protein